MNKIVFFVSFLLAIGVCAAPVLADSPSSRSIRKEISKRIDASNIGAHNFEIEVNHGVVKLDGTVASAADRAVVQRIAADARGVHEVYDNLVVGRPSGMNGGEEGVARDVRAAILADPLLVNYNFNIEVDGDVATLRGWVKTEEERRRAEMVALRDPHIRTVHNYLSVPEGMSDEGLVQSVRRELRRNGIENVDDLRISAQNGVVTFGGEFPNHREGDRILSLALMVDGVKDIRSDFKITGEPRTVR